MARMHATLHVETRMLEFLCGYDSCTACEFPFFCATTPEDLAAVLDSLTWRPMQEVPREERDGSARE